MGTRRPDSAPPTSAARAQSLPGAGTLRLKGIARPVEVPFAWTGTADAATMEGELTVGRSDFGIGTGEWARTDVIGAEVKLRFRLRLRKAG